MSNVMVGGIPGFYIYFCRNSTWKSGDPSSDKHIPFNPIAESVGIGLPQQTYDLIPDASDLYPQINVDRRLEPSTISIRTYFREPFLLLCLFSHKELPSAWTGTSDTITANFSDRANVDNNIAIQLRIPDPSSTNHLDLLFDGGRITEYRWIGEAGGAVMEEVSIQFAEITQNTEAVDIDDGFDDGAFDNATLGLDGGWALWEANLFPSRSSVLLTKDVTITVGGSSIDGLIIQGWELTIPVPVAMEAVASSLVSGVVYEEVRGPWTLNVRGKLKDNTDIAEVMKTLSDKTKQTIKLEYGTSPLTKYFQFTNGVLKLIDGLTAPRAGEPIDVTYNYEGSGGSVMSYVWYGSEATDPSNLINHTDV